MVGSEFGPHKMSEKCNDIIAEIDAALCDEEYDHIIGHAVLSGALDIEEAYEIIYIPEI